MAHVFISYARRDIGFVERLAQGLQSAGIQVWYDIAAIGPGQDWAAQIEKAVLDASVVLYVSSSASNASRSTQMEVDAALSKQIPVIPLILDELPSSVALQASQWIDFRTDYQSSLDHLILRVPRLAKVASVEEDPQPLRPKSKGYVFLSYAEEDSDFASQLREFLKVRGFAYWDYQESDRDYHRQYALELEEVITGAVATLALLSPDWKVSKWAPKEYMFCEEAGIPVFLLRLRDMGPTLFVAGVPYIDFVVDRDHGFSRLDSELRRKGLI